MKNPLDCQMQRLLLLQLNNSFDKRECLPPWVCGVCAFYMPSGISITIFALQFQLDPPSGIWLVLMPLSKYFSVSAHNFCPCLISFIFRF